MTNLPLAGVKVVEVASHVFVPMAGSVLSEWGAEVLKIEHPETGDPYRGLATVGLHTVYRGADTFFQSANRGKRSIGMDLLNADGRRLLSRFLESCDVFATNFRAETRRRLSIDVDAVRHDNPSVIYVRGTAFGNRGPEAGRGGYDTGAYWARSGMQHLMTPTGAAWPASPRAASGDVVGALAIAGAVSAALYRRASTGEPSVIDVSLLAAGMWQVQTDIVNASIAEDPTAKDPTAEDPTAEDPTVENRGAAPLALGRSEVWNPLMLPYRTADGRFVALMMLSPDRHWAALCRSIGRPDLTTDTRFVDMDARRAHAAACVAELDAIFETRTLAEWRKALDGFDGEWAAVQTPAEVLEDPQVQANRWIANAELSDGAELPLVTSPVQFDDEPGRPRRAPEHGEDTEQLLLELGLSWDDIADLKERGAVL